MPWPKSFDPFAPVFDTGPPRDRPLAYLLKMAVPFLRRFARRTGAESSAVRAQNFPVTALVHKGGTLFVLGATFASVLAACDGSSGTVTKDAGVDASDGSMTDAGRNDASMDAGTPSVDSGPMNETDAAPDAGDAGLPAIDAGPYECPLESVRGTGRHRLFVQGAEAPPRADGTWPFVHEWAMDGSDAPLCNDTTFTLDENGDGVWQPGEEPRPLGPVVLVHGEHFLVGPGSFVEFTATLCEDITGSVAFYIPNFDGEGSVALHQLYVVHEGEEFLIAEVTDDEPGFSGYNPFVRLVEGNDPDVVPGDTLLMRSINVSGVAFSVMVWRPPSEYESWILVEVP